MAIFKKGLKIIISNEIASGHIVVLVILKCSNYSMTDADNQVISESSDAKKSIVGLLLGGMNRLSCASEVRFHNLPNAILFLDIPRSHSSCPSGFGI